MPDTDTQADDPGVKTPGTDCENCGRPGHEHDRGRVSHGDGQYSYELECPDGTAGGAAE